jgi:hypothetical protein
MKHSRKSKKSILTSVSKRALPIVNKGLMNIGSVASSSIPIVEKSVSAVYGTMATGFDMGVKGTKSLRMNKRSRSKRRSRRRSSRRRSSKRR